MSFFIKNFIPIAIVLLNSLLLTKNGNKTKFGITTASKDLKTKKNNEFSTIKFVNSTEIIHPAIVKTANLKI